MALPETARWKDLQLGEGAKVREETRLLLSRPRGHPDSLM